MLLQNKTQTNEVRVPQTEMSTIVFEAFCTAPVPTQAVWECSVLLMASIPGRGNRCDLRLRPSRVIKMTTASEDVNSKSMIVLEVCSLGTQSATDWHIAGTHVQVASQWLCHHAQVASE